jgi:hypothetical protein
MEHFLLWWFRIVAQYDYFLR